MKKFLIAAYRDWAKNAYLKLRANFIGTYFEVVVDEQQLEQRARELHWDAVILIGWSWKIPADIINDTLIIGMHPSDLPHYAGGSPIQNQIIDGLTRSQATLFKLNEQFDAGQIIDKEPYSLDGHIASVFKNLSSASVTVIGRFIDRYPTIPLQAQGPSGSIYRRLKPEQSQLTTDKLSAMTAKQLYDFIRCHEDPYPNVYIEDVTGILIFNRVEFTPKS